MTVTREVHLKLFHDDDDDPYFYLHWGHLTPKEFRAVRNAIELITGKPGERYD